ncbi:UNVERIFIED_CONTAM: copper amine oxidase-like protein [Acetivibrio alkalicellulosi]
MKNKLTAIMIVVIMSFIPVLSVNGSRDVTVKVDGEVINFPDVKAYIDENGRTMVPVRFVSEALGAEVLWDGEYRVVTIKKDIDVITIKIGEKRVNKNGRPHEIDTRAVIRSDRTFVPLRFVSEMLGASVGWIAATRTVEISTTGEVVDKKVEIINGYTVPIDTGSRLRVSGDSFELGNNYPEIDMLISFGFSGLEQRLDEAEQILRSKLDDKLVDEVMAYARKKTDREYDLPRKIINYGNLRIWVEGPSYSDLNISVYVK